MADEIDVLDELEALVLDMAPPKKAEIKSGPETADSVSPLVKIFQERSIRILGTVEDPLVCAADVAAHIGDAAYRHKIDKYTPDEYMATRMTIDIRGQRRRMQHLTEAGLYKYLLQAKGEKAEEFQRFVYKLLKEERKRTVDSIQLALKIARSEADELRKEKVVLQRDRSSAMRLANDAREEVTNLKKEVKAMRRQKYASADAEELRLCGRQVEQIPGWNC